MVPALTVQLSLYRMPLCLGRTRPPTLAELVPDFFDACLTLVRTNVTNQRKSD